MPQVYAPPPITARICSSEHFATSAEAFVARRICEDFEGDAEISEPLGVVAVVDEFGDLSDESMHPVIA
jgi:hypothetical protein